MVPVRGAGQLVRTHWSYPWARHNAPSYSRFSVLVRAIGDRWGDSASRAARDCCTPDLNSYEFPVSWPQLTDAPRDQPPDLQSAVLTVAARL